MMAAFAEFSVISTSCMREPLLGSPPLAPKAAPVDGPP